ncbi:MAG: pilus assembly protein [Paracoccaceae bacterium]|nr:pilus assembly protein [Paracoccaceae bacterium]
MKIIHAFLTDDAGTVTIDWVALTSGILLLGIMVVYGLFNGGVSSLTSTVSDTLETTFQDVDPGIAEDINQPG